MHFSPIGKDLHTLHRVVQVLSNNFYFMFSGIYASTKFKRRKVTWSTLKDIAGEIDLPWLVIGDFIEVYSQSEKLGGKPIKLNRCLAFNLCIWECGLIDVKSSGLRYTWTNKSKKNL